LRRVQIPPKALYEVLVSKRVQSRNKSASSEKGL
jgi:hypothetical protein